MLISDGDIFGPLLRRFESENNTDLPIVPQPVNGLRTFRRVTDVRDGQQRVLLLMRAACQRDS
jgi:hypothetical protein